MTTFGKTVDEIKAVINEQCAVFDAITDKINEILKQWNSLDDNTPDSVFDELEGSLEGCRECLSDLTAKMLFACLEYKAKYCLEYMASIREYPSVYAYDYVMSRIPTTAELTGGRVE